MMKTVVLSAVVAILLIPLASQAEEIAVRDADDTASFIDIRSTTAAHGHDGRLKHSITTIDRWRSRKLGTCASLGLIFPEQDKDVSVFWGKGELRARLVDRRTSNPKVLGHPRVWRRDARTVTVSISRAKLGVGGADSYKWRAVSGAPEDRCPPEGTTDFGISADRAPDKTHAVHQL